MYVLINFVCMKTDEIKTEIHPLEPFFPQGARLLMMGSFPPKRERWKMDFYYPNFQNDMWRIFGLVFFDDKEHFLTADKKIILRTTDPGFSYPARNCLDRFRPGSRSAER